MAELSKIKRNYEQEIEFRRQQSERYKKLWAALNAFVGQNDGWIISAPGDKQIRIEYPAGGSLPIRIAELGYRLNFIGSATRNDPRGIIAVEVIEMKLPVR